MPQRKSGAGTYILFLFVLIFIVVILSKLNEQNQDPYSRELLIRDLEAGNVKKVLIVPNRETPTGTVTVALKDSGKKVFQVTDIREIENLVRSGGVEPEIGEVKPTNWMVETLLPMLIVLIVGFFLFMIFFSKGSEQAYSGINKMLYFVKSRARMKKDDKHITFEKVAG
ncbi:MAG: ATP-dependent metallopeptidase FtsH/Yme1/Tma family protein, partial [Lachnospiraceae bacterium]|nr:ATP-dependent metallopeptidase FtsH/Yme1/Tma family protein [Lachnospiraceae bacterium]